MKKLFILLVVFFATCINTMRLIILPEKTRMQNMRLAIFRLC